MRMRTSYLGSVLAVGAAAVLAAAPIAGAMPAPGQPSPGATASTQSGSAAPPSCMSLGGTQYECQSPGNAQINDSPPQVDYYPYAGGAT